MKMIIRILTAVLGVLALLAVAALWIKPDASAQGFGLTLNGAVGHAVVRADLAGLFLVLGILSLLAAVYQNRDYARAALVLTAAVLVGRVINLIASGMAPNLLPPVGLELVMIAVYAGGVQAWPAKRA